MSRLQDYVDCQRKFELKHILKIKWPAIECKPYNDYERNIVDGQHFHQLIHQHQVGLPLDLLQYQAQALDMVKWWNAYLSFITQFELPSMRYPEYRLSTIYNEHIIIGQYDLLAIDPEVRMVIVDWKTSTHKTSIARQMERIQSRFYPFLFISAGKPLNINNEIRPESIEMIYWYANFPAQLIHLKYSSENYHQDQLFFDNLLEEIIYKKPGQFLLTGNHKFCLNCSYQSFCDRGSSAGPLSEDIDEINQDISVLMTDQITGFD